MYIGPWQEYKLARLLQKQAKEEDSKRLASQRPILPRQHSVDRSISRPDLKVEDVETSSVTSSTRSSTSFISTRSAPSRLGSQSSAQARLDGLYRDAERNEHRASASQCSGRGSSRPTSAASARPTGRPPLPGRPPPAKRPSGKKTAKQSEQGLLAQRRARIAQMQRLYGLGGEEDAAAEIAPSGVQAEAESSRSDLRSPLPREMPEASSYSQRSPPAAATAAPVVVTSLPPWQKIPDVVQIAADGAFSQDTLCRGGGLPTVPEDSSQKMNASQVDPLGLSLSGGVDDNLIAWSQGLRPEDLSPEATLESFFPTV
mmetsp:Transcript_10768/g.24597  ORF Transcript_10768/g.24597 Transcript_10768/m.24597 type:complete len:315 (+) Transcript_10768:67-1011(+)